MNTVSEVFSMSCLTSSDERGNNFGNLERIAGNLSCIIGKDIFDLKNAGIFIYDPFLIQEEAGSSEFYKLPKYRAISLRSKSTRNLRVRRNHRRKLS
jgi:hypothetical protein